MVVIMLMICSDSRYWIGNGNRGTLQGSIKGKQMKIRMSNDIGSLIELENAQLNTNCHKITSIGEQHSYVK